MNREILFRGKRIDNGEWIYGFYTTDYPNNDRHMILSHDVSGEYGGLIYTSIDPTTIGQFTGQIDKCGMKIFEGDIVYKRWNEGSMKYKVAFDNCLSAFIGNRIGSVMFTSFDGDGDLFEVVGNIYDDPELEEVAQ